MKLILAGWGLDDFGGSQNNELHFADLPMWTFNECRRAYPPLVELNEKGQLCAGFVNGGADACQVNINLYTNYSQPSDQ